MTEHHSHAFSASGNSTPVSPDPPTAQTFVKPHFPPSDTPRVWFLTAGDAPISVSVTQQLLEHGDYVVAGLSPAVIPGREGPRAELDALASRYPSNPSEEQDSLRADYAGGNNLMQGDGASRNNIDHSHDEDEDMSGDSPGRPTHQHGQHQQGQLSLVTLEISSLSSIQSAYATAVALHGRIDILLVANNETVIGCVEELSVSTRAQSLLREQFSTNFFGPVNAIKAVLSVFRQVSSPPSQRTARPQPSLPRQDSSASQEPKAAAAASSNSSKTSQGGHIILLTGITGHLGTPGLGAYCASQWAVEGYCDSLAYEVAPFNVRISILQSNIEVGVLTNPISAVPAIPGAYGVGSGSFRHEQGEDDEDEDGDDAMDADGSERVNKAPLARGWLGSLVGRLEDAAPPANRGEAAAPQPDKEGSRSIIEGKRATSIGCLPMPESFRDALIAETVYAVLAIGGHDNPPARHIVSNEGVTSVKEKLKTVSEELEDFVGASLSVDLA